MGFKCGPEGGTKRQKVSRSDVASRAKTTKRNQGSSYGSESSEESFISFFQAQTPEGNSRFYNVRLKRESFCGKLAESGALFWEMEAVRGTKAGGRRQEASHGSRTGTHSRRNLDSPPEKPLSTLIKHRLTCVAEEHAIFRCSWWRNA